MVGHVFIATSLDGYIARNDGDIRWLIETSDPQEDYGYESFIRKMDGIVMGRGTYEKVLTFESWPYAQPVLVLSKHLANASVPECLKGRVHFSALSPQAAMKHLEQEGLKNVYVDGGQVIQSFLRKGLISELTLTRVPILIGGGRPLFGSLAQDLVWVHLSTRAFPSGLVQSHYRVKQ